MNRTVVGLSSLLLVLVTFSSCLSPAVPVAGTSGTSVVFGGDPGDTSHPDAATVANPPSSGFVYSVWTMVRPEDRLLASANPGQWWDTGANINDYWHHTNMYVGALSSSKWHLRVLTANSDAMYTDSSHTALQYRYNANGELLLDGTTLTSDPEGAYVDDYNYFESGYETFTDSDYNPATSAFTTTNTTYGPLTGAQITGWVWMAWQFLPKTDGTGVVIHQWVKFGVTGPVISVTQPNRPTVLNYADMKSFAGTNGDSSWMPSSDFTKLTVGSTGTPSYLTKARVDAYSTEPSITQLNDIATGASPASSAWASWPLTWNGSGADLSDASGNNRPLVPLSGARFSAGSPGPY